MINADFEEVEIKAVVGKLKNNKSHGVDMIINEFIKETIDIMCPIYVKLFNLILKSGLIPEDWSVGIIVPLYKKKGNVNDPTNYRGITLLSCFCKLFTSVLSQRLYKYVENFEVLGAEQAGFRRNHSTVDHIFVLHTLIELYCKKNKSQLYCAFVDYSKAFDIIPRVHLWSKLLSSNINGKILDIIRNMYSSAKSFIRNNNDIGTMFNCSIGVRQGENVSPLLFALYINDLQAYLSKAFSGLDSVNKMIEHFNENNDTVMYLKLLILLYADDTIIMAESSYELQAALNGLYHYCEIWKLNVNVSKTKVVIFSNRQPKLLPKFSLGDLNVEVISGYSYLGIYMKCNGNMSDSIVNLNKQASRATYALIQKCRKLGLAIDIQLHLFDSIIVPICLYGCEVWGFKNIDIVEKLHLQFCKSILYVNKSTPNCMVLGDLGRLKLKHMIDLRMLNFWYRVTCTESHKLSNILYKLVYNLSERNVYETEWIRTVKNYMLKYNLYGYWENQNKLNMQGFEQFKKECKMKVKEYYKNEWANEVNECKKAYLYKGMKDQSELKIEKYLLCLPTNLRITMTKFRMCNHKLPIEIGRHFNLERQLRVCEWCDELGDEYHYLCECKHFKNDRTKFIPKFMIRSPSVKSYCELLATKSKKKLVKIAKFCKIIMSNF